MRRQSQMHRLRFRVERLASGLWHEGIATSGTFVGILGFGSIDWVVAELACLYLSAVSVPLQVGMNPADLTQIVRETELACIVCSAEQLDALRGVLPPCPSVGKCSPVCSRFMPWRA